MTTTFGEAALGGITPLRRAIKARLAPLERTNGVALSGTPYRLSRLVALCGCVWRNLRSMCAGGADVAICAANIFVDSTATFVGGTSLSAPLSMGSWARIESSHGNQLGFASPLIYQPANGALTLPSPWFNNVIRRRQRPLHRSSGVTGLGSWDILVVNHNIPLPIPSSIASRTAGNGPTAERRGETPDSPPTSLPMIKDRKYLCEAYIFGLICDTSSSNSNSWVIDLLGRVFRRPLNAAHFRGIVQEVAGGASMAGTKLQKLDV